MAKSPQWQQLLDRQQINDLVWSYCRAVDRRDFEQLRSLYHEDATDEHGGMFSGRAMDFIDQLPSIMEPMEVVYHFIGNMLIRVEGDQGTGEIYSIVYHRARLPEGLYDIVVGGRYLDRYQRRAGHWKFRQRKIVMDWNQIQPSVHDPQSPLLQGVPQGSSLPTDPSFAFLGWSAPRS